MFIITKFYKWLNFKQSLICFVCVQDDIPKIVFETPKIEVGTKPIVPIIPVLITEDSNKVQTKSIVHRNKYFYLTLFSDLLVKQCLKS